MSIKTMLIWLSLKEIRKMKNKEFNKKQIEYLRKIFRHKGITKTKTEVIILRLCGYTNKEVGKKLFVCEKTVKTHFSFQTKKRKFIVGIYTQFDVRNLTQLLWKIFTPNEMIELMKLDSSYKEPIEKKIAKKAEEIKIPEKEFTSLPSGDKNPFYFN